MVSPSGHLSLSFRWPEECETIRRKELDGKCWLVIVFPFLFLWTITINHFHHSFLHRLQKIRKCNQKMSYEKEREVWRALVSLSFFFLMPVTSLLFHWKTFSYIFFKRFSFFFYNFLLLRLEALSLSLI